MTQDSNQTGGILAALSDELAAAVERVAPSVVRVDARRRHNPASGVIWTADGLILTAEHVLERDEDIKVGLGDGRELAATIAGRDPGTDIALLRIQATGLAAIERGSTPRVGHFTLALARAGSQVAATGGIISAVGGPVRTWRGGQLEGFIRTDATFFPGLSGGPLIDTRGRMIGLATSHFGRGAGFGIPMETLVRVTDVLSRQGRIRRGYLGITSQPVAVPPAIRQRSGLAQESGLLIINVEPNSPADRGGILLGDILMALDGHPVRDTDDLPALLTGDRVGRATPLRVLRGGELKDLLVTIGERP
jgi:S1-C subfamily serine protease